MQIKEASILVCRLAGGDAFVTWVGVMDTGKESVQLQQSILLKQYITDIHETYLSVNSFPAPHA